MDELNDYVNDIVDELKAKLYWDSHINRIVDKTTKRLFVGQFLFLFNSFRQLAHMEPIALWATQTRKHLLDCIR